MAAFRTTFEVQMDPSTVYEAVSTAENLVFLMPGLEAARLLQGDGGEASLLDLVLEGGDRVYAWVQRAEPGQAWEVVDQDGRRARIDLRQEDGRTVAQLVLEDQADGLDPDAVASEVRSRLAKLLVSLEPGT